MVVRRGSVRAAAASLFVTEPSVSAAVAALEKEIRVPLFERRGRGIVPTPAGAALADYVTRALGILEQGLDAARHAARPGSGRLRLAAVTTAGEAILPVLLREFRTRFPDIEPILEVGNRASTIERLLGREADLAIGGRPPAGRGIAGARILENQLVLVAAPDHALARGRPATPDELAGATWLLREEGSGTRSTAEEYFVATQIEPASRLTLGSNGSVKQAAILGLGITLIPRLAVEGEVGSGLLHLIPAPNLPLKRSWQAWFLDQTPLPPAADLFLRFVRSPAARRALHHPPRG